MASVSNLKRLSEILKEQQEPFRLDVYLYERGCKGMRQKRSSNGAVKICSGIAKDFCKKLVCINDVLKLKDSSFGSGEFTSFSESDVEEDSAADKMMMQWRLIEENKQCSPVSVLDEIELISNGVRFSGQELEEQHQSRLSLSFFNLLFSSTLWDLFIHKRGNKKEIVGTSKRSFSRYTNKLNNDLIMEEKQHQLLFDCVREAVESRGRKRKAEHFKKIKQYVDESINKLVRSDFPSSYQEQDDDLESFGNEIAREVGDEILEEIKDEIVDLYLCKNS